MKKLIKILIVLTLIPSSIFACPHYDKDGNVHMQTYNEDYTEINMIYPRDKYLYQKNVTSIMEDYYIVPEEDNILNETYSFALYQNSRSYYNYYWFIDESLDSSSINEVTKETTVKNLENILVTGSNYSLLVNFKNTLNESNKLVNDITQEIYYDVLVENKNLEDFKILKENNIKVLSENMLDIFTRYSIIDNDDYNYDNSYESIKVLHDEITIEMKVTNTSDNIVAVNLDKGISEYIEVTKTKDNYYSFNIDEIGTYVLIEKPEEEIKILAQNVETIEVEVQEENVIEEPKKEDNIIFIITSSFLGITLIIILLIVILNKKK